MRLPGLRGAGRARESALCPKEPCRVASVPASARAPIQLLQTGCAEWRCGQASRACWVLALPRAVSGDALRREGTEAAPLGQPLVDMPPRSGSQVSSAALSPLDDDDAVTKEARGTPRPSAARESPEEKPRQLQTAGLDRGSARARHRVSCRLQVLAGDGSHEAPRQLQTAGLGQGRLARGATSAADCRSWPGVGSREAPRHLQTAAVCRAHACATRPCRRRRCVRASQR